MAQDSTGLCPSKRLEPSRAGASRIEPHQDAVSAAQAAVDKHAEDVVILDVRQLSGVTDFFVMVTARSRPQVLAIVEAVEAAIKRRGRRVHHVEGLTEPGRTHKRQADAERLMWVLLDAGSIVMHVFDPLSREFYKLERLWGDAPRVAIDSPHVTAS